MAANPRPPRGRSRHRFARSWRRPSVALLVLAAASCALSFPESRRLRAEVARLAPEEPAVVPVVLFADELHTGLVLEREWLERHGWRRPEGVPAQRYVAFSWGDETAYVQERWMHPGQVAHALFMPSSSVMEVISFDWNVPEVCPTQRLYQGFARDSAGGSLVRFLNGCKVMREDGVPLEVAASTWGEGVMVRSPHAYYFPRICNVWTVEALNAGGFEFGGAGGISANGVIRQAQDPRNGFRKIWDPAWQMEPPPEGAP